MSLSEEQLEELKKKTEATRTIQTQEEVSIHEMPQQEQIQTQTRTEEIQSRTVISQAITRDMQELPAQKHSPDPVSEPVLSDKQRRKRLRAAQKIHPVANLDTMNLINQMKSVQTVEGNGSVLPFYLTRHSAINGKLDSKQKALKKSNEAVVKAAKTDAAIGHTLADDAIETLISMNFDPGLFAKEGFLKNFRLIRERAQQLENLQKLLDETGYMNTASALRKEQVKNLLMLAEPFVELYRASLSRYGIDKNGKGIGAEINTQQISKHFEAARQGLSDTVQKIKAGQSSNPAEQSKETAAHKTYTCTDRNLTGVWKEYKGSLFPAGEVSAEDIIQGSVGDCFLVATLASLAKSNPKFIKDSIIDKNDGYVSVRFFDDNKPVYITVEKTRNDRLSKGAPWVAMFEKAYMVFRTETADHPYADKFSNLDEGDTAELAMEVLTGKLPVTVSTAEYEVKGVEYFRHELPKFLRGKNFDPNWTVCAIYPGFRDIFYDATEYMNNALTDKNAALNKLKDIRDKLKEMQANLTKNKGFIDDADPGYSIYGSFCDLFLPPKLKTVLDENTDGTRNPELEMQEQLFNMISSALSENKIVTFAKQQAGYTFGHNISVIGAYDNTITMRDPYAQGPLNGIFQMHISEVAKANTTLTIGTS